MRSFCASTGTLPRVALKVNLFEPSAIRHRVMFQFVWILSNDQAGSFNTVEGFWKNYVHLKRPSKIVNNVNVYLFRDAQGHVPMWEASRWQLLRSFHYCLIDVKHIAYQINTSTFPSTVMNPSVTSRGFGNHPHRCVPFLSPVLWSLLNVWNSCTQRYPNGGCWILRIRKKAGNSNTNVLGKMWQVKIAFGIKVVD